MKAISVRQPWAWAILFAHKDVENRTRNIAGSYRGPLVIHAGLAEFEKHNMASRALRAAHGSEVPTVVDFGAALGIVGLAGVHHFGECVMTATYHCDDCEQVSACSRWAEQANVWHLELANPRPFPEPIPYRGALGLWEFPDDLLPKEFR